MSFGLDGVSIRFGGKDALDDVTFAANSSEITVVIGGDGAGKTTCMRTLVGLVGADSGVVSRPAKEKIGYVPAAAGLYVDLTVEENLSFVAHAYDIGRGDFTRTSAALLERIGLSTAEQRLGGQLSGGMQRKLAVALALVHSPELLVLDEPTTGVDPVSRADLWRLISAAAAAGAAVVLATTYVNEAARATSVVLLESGRAIAAGTPEQILWSVPGSLGTVRGGPQPSERSWRRGSKWRVWTPSGESPPADIEPCEPDFQDAVIVASLAAESAGTRR